MSSHNWRGTLLTISSRCASRALSQSPSLAGSAGRAPSDVHEPGGALVLESVLDDKRRDRGHACGEVEGLADAGSERGMEEEGVRRRRRG